MITFVAWVCGFSLAAISLERMWRYNVLRGAWRAERENQEDLYDYMKSRTSYALRAERYLAWSGISSILTTLTVSAFTHGVVLAAWLIILFGSYLWMARRYNEGAQAHRHALELVRKWDRDHRAMNR